MKESISLTTIFQIVILFILLFAGIMALTINNSNAFGVKDEIGNIIQLSNGEFLDGSDGEVTLNTEVVDKIKETSYRTTGKCDEGYTGFDRNGKEVEKNGSASICIKCVNTTSAFEEYITEHLLSGEKVGFETNENLPGYYYEIIVFNRLDLPIIKLSYNLKTKSETKIIYGTPSRLCK